MGRISDTAFGSELFGEAYARGSDPKTSRDAADHIKGDIASACEIECLKAISKYPRDRGMTKDEIHSHTKIVERDTVSPRLKQLREKGFTEFRYGANGKKIVRPGKSGRRQQQVEFITDTGIAFLKSIGA